MTEVLKVRDRRSVWIHGGDQDVTSVVVDTYEDFCSVRSDSVAYYCLSPKNVPPAVLADTRLAAIICPTPSPFSHDANLMRSLANQRGITAICGLRLTAEDMNKVVTLKRSRSRSRSLIEVGGTRIPVAEDLAGSDEALARLASRSAICYRPYYLYDEWLGHRVRQGLEAGVGHLIVGPSAKALRDTDGRIWLLEGPTPGEIAEWIFSNPSAYIAMLIRLIRALRTLTFTSWTPSLILNDSQFLESLDVNFQVAPFIGFPLYSLTRLAEASPGTGQEPAALESRVAAVSQLLPIADRQRGAFSSEVLDSVLGYLESLSGSSRVAGADLAAATILLSDLRRIAIDGLRRTYPAFNERTRHRSLN
jgi:hypothetical protein